MLEHQAGSAIEPMTESFTLPSEVPSEPPSTPSYKGATNSQAPLWQPTEPQFTKAIADYYSVSRKSVQQWFQKVRAACPWLSEGELKLPDDRYTPLCVALMGDYRLTGLPLDAWKTAMWERHPEQVAAFLETQRQSSAVLSALLPDAAPKSTAPATAQSADPFAQSAIESRLNLPTIQPVGSAIVPTEESLPTDSREAQTLAATGTLAIQQNAQDLTQIRALLQQVNQFVDSKIEQLDSETQQTQQQVQELRDLAFQLEVKQETLRRAEVRNAASRQESESARTAATAKVVDLSDFFSRKSQPRSGS